MTATRKERNRLISDTLECVSPWVRADGKGRWDFALVNGTSAAAHAALQEGWLTLVVPLQEATDSASDWNLLRDNGTLPGLCKFALDDGQRCRHLRVDLPLDWESEPIFLPRRLREACAGFLAVLGRLHGSRESGELKDAGIACNPDGDHAEGTDLPHLLDEAGWQCTQRSASKFTVDLEVRGGLSQAVVEVPECRGVVAYTDVAKWETLGCEQREAAGILLLSASKFIRMVRATVVESEKESAARFEVRFESPAVSTELSHVLSALSVAANLYRGEAQSFEDERIAKAYLAARRAG
jgi:hypothetical protein